jgi:hypothetical protein
MYVCQECHTPVGPGITRKLNVEYRTVDGRREIAKETPVCTKCWKDPRAAAEAEAEFRRVMNSQKITSSDLQDKDPTPVSQFKSYPEFDDEYDKD